MLLKTRDYVQYSRNKYKFWYCFTLMAHELKLHYNEITAEHSH